MMLKGEDTFATSDYDTLLSELRRFWTPTRFSASLLERPALE
jgi:hypothetical protein